MVFPGTFDWIDAMDAAIADIWFCKVDKEVGTTDAEYPANF